MTENASYQGVLFDMDGVIIDSAKVVESFWQPRLKQKGVVLSEKEFLEKLHGRPVREIIRELFVDETEQERKKFLQACEKFDRNHFIELMPGVKDLLNGLLDHQIPTGLVTSAFPSKVRSTLDALGSDSDQYFSAIVTSEDVKEGKPHPECYQKAAEALGLQAEECVVFEDSINGIRAGHAAGALVTGINKPRYKDLLKQEGAYAVLPNFLSAGLQKSENGSVILSLDGKSFAVEITPGKKRTGS